MLLIRKTKEPTEIVFDVTHGMRFLTLGDKRAFDKFVEVRKRPGKGIEGTMLRIGTV
jgi:CRISPR-associated DxTHG motif protein